MEERRIVRIGESMKTFAEVDRQVIPIIGKCLDEITKAAESIDHKNVSVALFRLLLLVFSINHLWRLKSSVRAAAQELYSHRTKTKNSFLSQATLSEAGCAQIISQIYLTPSNASTTTLFQLFFFYF